MNLQKVSSHLETHVGFREQGFISKCRNRYKKLKAATVVDVLKWCYCSPACKMDISDIFISDLAGGLWLVFFNQMKQMSILDGNMQQYVYKQEPAKKCQRRSQVTIRYPAYVPRLVIRRRFQRAVRMPTIIQTVRINPYPSGNLCLLSFFYTTVLLLVVSETQHSVPFF